MTALVQSGSTSWQTGTEGSTKTITLGAAATVGNVVIVEVSYSRSIISSVSGLGGTWNVLRSRGQSGSFECAEIWYCVVGSSGQTAITITPNSSFTIDGGSAIAKEYSGLTGSVVASSELPDHVNAAAQSTGTLSANTDDLTVAVVTQTTTAGPSSSGGTPGTWTVADQYNYNGGGGNTTWMVHGEHIATGSESDQFTATWSFPTDGVVVGGVFSGSSPDRTVPGEIAAITTAAPAGTVSVGIAVAGPTATVAVAALAGLAGSVTTVAGPVATVAVAALAGVAREVPTFAGYALDDNNSQALNIPVQMSAVLEADPIPTSLTGHTDAQIRALRRSLTMPTPTLDARGRPT